MFHTFPRNHSVRFLIITVALACLASWATFLTYSHNENAKRNPSRKASASKEVGAERSDAAKPDDATRVRVSEAYGKLPLSFEANRGQTDSRVSFRSRGGAILRRTTAMETLFPSAKTSPGLRGAPKLKAQENSQQFVDDGDIPRAKPPVRKPVKP